MNQFKHPPEYQIIIHYENGDELLHTAANGYKCGSLDCSCAEYHPGEFIQREAITQRMRAAAQRTDPRPTEILPKPTLPLPDIAGQGDEQTWEVPAPPHRRTEFWHRVRRFFHR
jgi:hypothetical protein